MNVAQNEKWDCDLYWMGHVCILPAKYWKPPEMEEPWLLWETYSALHCTSDDKIFSVFEFPRHLSYYIWVCCYWKELGSTIFEISFQRNLRLFVRGKSPNPFISSQGWCVLGLWSSCSSSLDPFEEDVANCSIPSAASPGLQSVENNFPQILFCWNGSINFNP